MPSGRDIHTIKSYELPELDRSVLDATRAPPDQQDDVVYESSGDEAKESHHRTEPAGAYPGTRQEYNSTPGYY